MTTAELEELIWKIDLMLSDTPDKLFSTIESEQQMVSLDGVAVVLALVFGFGYFWQWAKVQMLKKELEENKPPF